MSTDGSEDDEDYDAYMETHHNHLDAKRFPIHDACEFDSLEALKVRSCVEDFFRSSLWWRWLHAEVGQTEIFSRRFPSFFFVYLLFACCCVDAESDSRAS